MSSSSSSSGLTDGVPWRAALDAAIRRNPLELAKYLSLATLGLDGTPRSRLVRFHGWHQDLLVFCTDSRSEKVREIEAHGAVEVSWYFPMTREQFRLRCVARSVGAAEADAGLAAARAQAWGALGDKDRIEFCSLPPGAVWVDPKAAAQDIDLDLYDAQSLDRARPVDHFLAVCLDAHHIDYLIIPPPVADEIKPRHRESPRESILQQNKVPKRFIHKRDKDNQWTITRVNP